MNGTPSGKRISGCLAVMLSSTQLQVKPRPPPAEPTADDPKQRQKRGPTKSGYSIVSIGAVCCALRTMQHLEFQLKSYTKVGMHSANVHKRSRAQTMCVMCDTEPTQRVNGHIAIIASPPDARYAPLHAGGPRTFGAVRALVFPLTPETTNKASTGRHMQTHAVAFVRNMAC